MVTPHAVIVKLNTVRPRRHRRKLLRSTAIATRVVETNPRAAIIETVSRMAIIAMEATCLRAGM